MVTHQTVFWVDLLGFLPLLPPLPLLSLSFSLFFPSGLLISCWLSKLRIKLIQCTMPQLEWNMASCPCGGEGPVLAGGGLLHLLRPLWAVTDLLIVLLAISKKLTNYEHMVQLTLDSAATLLAWSCLGVQKQKRREILGGRCGPKSHWQARGRLDWS